MPEKGVIDLRGVSKLVIKTLALRPRAFTLSMPNNADFSGSTATLKIFKNPNENPIETITVGSGITIVDGNKMIITLPSLPAGDYYYILDVALTTGSEFYISDRLYSTNE